MLTKQKKNLLIFNQKTKISEIILKMQDIAICVNDRNHVVGIFTEGDFRKSVLKGINTNNQISRLMNKNFYYVGANYTRKSVLEIFSKKNTKNYNYKK